MEQAQYNSLFSFIWNIATDVLVYAFDKSEYKKIILPMMVLRRIDVLLEPTKKQVISMKENLDKNHIDNQAPILYNVTGYPFYNTSKFTMKTLKSEIDAQRLKMNFIEYLNGYSKDVLDIVEKLHLRQVIDNLTRIGKIELPEIAPCLGSAETQFYRNKLEFTFADRRWLTREEIESAGDIGDAPAVGFHIPGMFDKVLDIRKCWLQPDPSNGIRMEAKRFCVENGYTFHNARSHEGLMRNMIVRTASTGEVMVIVVFNSDDRPRITALMDHLAAKFPEITSLFYIVNTKFNDSVGDLDPVCYRGKDHIIEEMEELRFKVGPKSFYQTNSAQAYELYKVARDFADLRPGDVLYDLYTGTGTIANFCAARCARVVGVEYVPEAIADAKVNSELNGIENTVFYAGDMKAVLDDGFVAANGRPDVIILDPPRAGVDEPVIEVILRAAPERIVYVSCNPATQARDLQLMDAAYRVEAVQPVDMFPHTHHVENVVKLVRR